jgi:hypothetical protein
MGTSCDASRGLNRTVAEQLSMLPVGLIIDLSLVRRIDADGLEALTIAATLAGESDIALCEARELPPARPWTIPNGRGIQPIWMA